MRKIFIILILMLSFSDYLEAQNPVTPGIDYKGNHYNFTLTGDLKGFKATFSSKTDRNGVEYLVLILQAKEKITASPLSLRWSIPSIDIQGTWSPGRNFNKYLNPSWKENSFLSRAATNAPVTSLFNFDSGNRLTFACSDALNSLKMSSGINESTAMLDCEVQLFTEPQPDLDHYELILRLDNRHVPYWESLKDVAKWWEEMPVYQANVSPEATKLPIYSTWYSFHQKLDAGAIESQCRLAKSLGCETVIVDDGWQTMDSSLGYAYTGDWKPERIPDMKAHVARVHQLGMKFMLWYSVPFVGEKSKVYPRFKGKYLYYKKRWGAYALDPRFPEVREYLIDTYESALRDWDLDGFKLDFVDSFVADENTVQQAMEGRDYASINDAVDKLLTEVMSRLRIIKPSIMIEFRQSYTGPLMRKYGNMFRAADAPNDALSNRVRTIDVRLMSGETAVHSDMLMWHKEESAEVAALQLLNILFSVPQISLKLDEIPLAHRDMLNFWLKFWRSNKDVLLDGDFRPENPELNYPIVTAGTEKKQVTVVYAPQVRVKIKEKMPAKAWIVNASHGNNVVLELSTAQGLKSIKVLDCFGKQLSFRKVNMGKGLHEIKVPMSGLVEII